MQFSVLKTGGDSNFGYSPISDLGVAFGSVRSVQVYLDDSVELFGGTTALTEYGFGGSSTSNFDVVVISNSLTPLKISTGYQSYEQRNPRKELAILREEENENLEPFSSALYSACYQHYDDTVLTEAFEYLKDEGLLDEWSTWALSYDFDEELLKYCVERYAHGKTVDFYPKVLEELYGV